MKQPRPRDPTIPGLCGCPRHGTREPCRNYVAPGASRCRFHGGHNRKGADHPNYRSGKFSAYLPERLRQRYLDGETDEELLSVRAEIALVTTRIGERCGELGRGEDSETWKEIADLVLTRTRLVDSEVAQMKLTQQFISAAEAMTLILAVADSVRRHCHDGDTVKRIAADIQRLANQTYPSTTPVAGDAPSDDE